MSKITTVTIWKKEAMEPRTVAFDDREKAEAYKRKMEEIFMAGGDPDYRVTIDSGDLNDGKTYIEEFSSEMGLPDGPEMEKITVTFAIDGRYSATVCVPKEIVPPLDAPAAERERFAEAVIKDAETNYYDADFGDLRDIVKAHAIIVEKVNGDIVYDRP